MPPGDVNNTGFLVRRKTAVCATDIDRPSGIWLA